MRITELFTAQSIALDEAQQDRSQIIDRLVELQATHGNIKDKEAYKKGLYAREDGNDRMKETVQANYRRIKEEVKQIVQEELERIAGDDNLKHLLQQK